MLAHRRHALGPDPVAEVEVAEVVVVLLADVLARDHQLDPAGAVAQVGEDQPAVAADQHQPPGDPHRVAVSDCPALDVREGARARRRRCGRGRS